MTEPADPILYSFRRCPFAMRARLALAISGTRYEVREISLRAKPTAMLAASAKGTVPILVLPEGKVIDQSLDIMRWALAQCDPEAWLERDDPPLISANDGSFKHDLDRYKYSDRHGADALKHRDQGLTFLRDLDVRLSIGAFLGGPVRGMTDAAIVPFARQFAAVDPDWFAGQRLPHLRRWLTNILGSSLFQSIMLRAPHGAR
ncbi:MAG: glutathione S-transferase [Pseudomonadota bacterium]